MPGPVPSGRGTHPLDRGENVDARATAFHSGHHGQWRWRQLSPTSGAGAGPRCSSRTSSFDGRRANARRPGGVWHRDVASRACRREHLCGPARRVGSFVGVTQQCRVAGGALPYGGWTVPPSRMSSTTIPSEAPERLPRRGTRRRNCSLPIAKRWCSSSFSRASNCTRCRAWLRCGFGPIPFRDVPVGVLALRAHPG